MKNYALIFTAIVLLSLSSCVNENTDDIILNVDNTFRIATSNVITQQDALKEVDALLEVIDIPTRAGGKRKIADCVKVGGFGMTRTEGVDESPLYYIANFENDEGFAVASGDNRTPPVFCITEQGHLDNLDFLNNPEDADIPGVAIMFSEYDLNYRVAVGLPIKDINNNVINPGTSNYPTWNPNPNPNPFPNPGDIIKIVNPYASYTLKYTPWANSMRSGTIIRANWGQGEPYNERMKDGQLAGCGPVAVALVMYHWGQPNGTMKYHKKELDWSRIRRHTTEFDNCTQTDLHSMIADLFYELHHSHNLNCIYFKKHQTATLIDNIPRTMKNFGYAKVGKTISYDINNASAALYAGRPVIVRGYAKKILGIVPMAEGHFWVLDQLLIQARQQQVYKNGIFQNSITETRKFVHVNWGWSGDNNGYYLPSRFNTVEGPAVRSGDSGFYRYNLDMNSEISWR